jgi:hypothetical protein
MSDCGDKSALQSRIALPGGDVGKMPTLPEDTGGPPMPPFEEAASSSFLMTADN